MESEVFRKLRPDELPQLLDLIQLRIDWMDRVGIRQWNVTDYMTVYPRSYFRTHLSRGNAFALTKGDQLLCVGVLKKRDLRWSHIPGLRQTEGLYLHHFAASPAFKGSGSRFLDLAEAYTKDQGYPYLRLDSAIDNPSLTEYYIARGYTPAGECIDGPYIGILRQKAL